MRTSEECRKDHIKYSKKYYEKNKVVLRAKQKIYAENHKEDVKRNNKKHSDFRRSWLLTIKKRRGCQDCGVKDVRILDLHHRDPSTKLFTIGTGRWFSQKTLKTELEKCDVLCANCHRIRHWEYIHRNISDDYENSA